MGSSATRFTNSRHYRAAVTIRILDLSLWMVVARFFISNSLVKMAVSALESAILHPASPHPHNTIPKTVTIGLDWLDVLRSEQASRRRFFPRKPPS